MKKKIIALTLSLGVLLSTTNCLRAQYQTHSPVVAEATTQVSGVKDTMSGIFGGKEPDINLVNEKLGQLINYTKLRFSDVNEGAWFMRSVAKLTGLGGIDGYGDGTFKPQNTMTVAEFVKLLLASMGYQQENDSKVWYKNYVDKAWELKVIEFGDDYNYNGGIKRKDMAKMICKILNVQPVTSGTSPFTDTKGIDSKWVDAAYNEYLIRGYIENGQRIFKPDGTATRAEVTEIIVRALEYRQNAQEYKRRKAEEFSKEEAGQLKDDANQQNLTQNINGFVTKVPQKSSSLAKIEGYDVAKEGKSNPLISMVMSIYEGDLNKQYVEIEDVLLQKIDRAIVDQVMSYVKSKTAGTIELKGKDFYWDKYIVYVNSTRGQWIQVGVYMK